MPNNRTIGMLLVVACLAINGLLFGRLLSPTAAADPPQLAPLTPAQAVAGPIIANEPPNMAFPTPVGPSDVGGQPQPAPLPLPLAGPGPASIPPPSVPGQPTPFTADALPPCLDKGNVVSDPPPASPEPPIAPSAPIAGLLQVPAPPPAQPVADPPASPIQKAVFQEPVPPAPPPPPPALAPDAGSPGPVANQLRPLPEIPNAAHVVRAGGMPADSATGPATPEILTGTHPTTFDPKVGLVLPASVREQLRRAPRLLFVAPNLDQTLSIYTPDGFERLVQLLHVAESGREADHWVDRLCFSRIECVAVDAANNCVLPAHLIRYAGISERVVLVGVRDHFELWNADAWDTWNTSHDLFPDDQPKHMTPERVRGGIQ